MFRDHPPVPSTAGPPTSAASPAVDSIVILRPTGFGRFFEAAFLIVWLAFWVIGEAAAVMLLITLFVSWLASIAGLPPPPRMPATPDVGFATLILFGVLVWVLFWTIGGIAALTRLGRALLGEDRVELTANGIDITRRIGPFGRCVSIARDTLREVRLRPPDRCLVLETSAGARDVTTFGTAADREHLLAWLRQHVAWPAPSQTAHRDLELAPPGWTLERDDDDRVAGRVRIAKLSRRTQKQQMAVAWGVTLFLASGWLASLSLGREPHAVSIILFTLVALCATGSIWLTWGRTEWVVSRGRMSFRRRFASRAWEQVFEDGWLDLTSGTDSDGDDYYTLKLHTPSERRRLASATHDAYELIKLANWLRTRTGFELRGLDG